MPGMDGFELCRLIRRDTIIGEMPVLLVTALDDIDSRLEGIEAGADDFLSKPIDRAELRLRVRTITRLNRYRKILAERTRFQHATQKAAREWVATVDAIASPVVVLDGRGAVRRMNAAARDLAGGTFESLLGRPLAGLGDGEPWSAAALLAADTTATSSPPTRRVRNGADGRVWEVATSRSTEDDQPVIVVARDVTAMVELEEEARRNEMMSVLGRLVGGFAHEVRNPLFSITAAIEAFEEDFGTREGFSDYFDVIRRETTRLTRLAQDLLEYGRPPRLEMTPGSLGAVMLRAADTCTLAAERAHVTVVPSVDAECIAEIDPNRMVQVFTNLIENAIQHSPHGGTVAIGSACVERRGSRWIECSIEDSGAGFDPNDLDKVFEPFYTRRHGGTGLGLSIVQRIAHQHGGEVAVHNRPSGGARVTVRIPAYDGEMSTDEQHTTQSTSR